jgi:hypothetical protein
MNKRRFSDLPCGFFLRVPCENALPRAKMPGRSGAEPRAVKKAAAETAWQCRSGVPAVRPHVFRLEFLVHLRAVRRPETVSRIPHSHRSCSNTAPNDLRCRKWNEGVFPGESLSVPRRTPWARPRGGWARRTKAVSRRSVRTPSYFPWSPRRQSSKHFAHTLTEYIGSPLKSPRRASHVCGRIQCRAASL